ncbi:aldo/keto reductase [Paraphaeosphaeria minitans]|uniref:Aldo/keto reductase n=1 Tax=Paraphaeosphaeria minitans TaxID=565426 RepID=A0A9P6G9P4_9PLEO|nr:aldo/keto reductase [Paraphaeosphaeria minitans]
MATKNRIILGLMTFGPDVEWGAKTTSLEEFGTFLDYFQAAGYDEGDTARTYQNGSQEGFTAAVGYKKRNLSIATKLYPFSPGAHEPKALREALEESLKQLETDCVNIFYLHAPDRSVPFEKTLQTVNELYKEGKFKQFGLSNYAAFEVAEIVMICREKGWVRPTIYQGCYNAITRGIENELIPACRRYGLDIVIYNGLAGGLFTGKYKAGKTEAPAQPSLIDKFYRTRYIQNGYLDALSIIEPIVTAHGLTLIEVAMRWLIHHSALKMRTDGGNDGLIIGASSLSQLDNNLAVIKKGPLPKEVVDALDDGWLAAKPTTPDYWHMDLEYTYDTQKALFGKSA